MVFIVVHPPPSNKVFTSHYGCYDVFDVPKRNKDFDWLYDTKDCDYVKKWVGKGHKYKGSEDWAHYGNMWQRLVIDLIEWGKKGYTVCYDKEFDKELEE